MTASRTDVLANAECVEEVFTSLDLSGATLVDRSFRGCRFERVRCAEASVCGTIFEDCVFTDCDLTLLQVAGASFRGVEFVRSKLMGIDWTDIRGLAFAVGFDTCVVSHCSFVDRKMHGAVFKDCKAHETNFMGVDLTKAVFDGTDLAGARFMDTVLVDADLSRALNYVVDPRHNRLQRTRFSVEAALALVGELGVIVPEA